MRARVKNGRWILDDPTDLPDGTELELVTLPAPPKASAEVYMDARVRTYIHTLLAAHGATLSHEEEVVEAAKANAFRANRRYTTPEDVKPVAREVLLRFVSPSVAETILAKTEIP